MSKHKLKLCLKLPVSIPAIIAYLSLKDKSYVDEDLRRLKYGSGIWNLHVALNDKPAFRTVFRIRAKQESGLKYALACLSYKTLGSFEFGCANTIGKGVAVWHGHGSVIYCNKIGENCSFYQNVTIGRGEYKGNGTQFANLGNGVSVYAGAIIIGGVTIGDNCKIGAGAVVTKDVPPNCTVVGNPMRIINNGKLK